MRYFSVFFGILFGIHCYSFGQSTGGSSNSKVFQLSSSLNSNYKTNGFLDFYDDNPTLSGKGLASNAINGNIEILLEWYPVNTAQSNTLWEQWRDNVKNGGNGLPISQVQPVLNLNNIRNNLYGVLRAYPGPKFYGGEYYLENKVPIKNPFTNANGDWSITLGGFHYNHTGGTDALRFPDIKHVWGEYETDDTHGGVVMPAGRYWLLVDFEFLYPVLIRPQAPKVNGVKVSVNQNSTKFKGLEYYSSSKTYVESSNATLYPEFNYAGESGVVLNSSYKKYRLNGTISGTLANDNGVIRSEIYPDYKSIVVEILNPDADVANLSKTTVFPNALGEWDVILDNLNTIGKDYKIAVYGYNSYNDEGERIFFKIKREAAFQPYAVNFYPANLVAGAGYEHGITSNFERVFFPKGQTISFKGSGKPGDKIETRLFPASYDSWSRYPGSSTANDFIARPLAGEIYMPKSSMNSSAVVDATGNWQVTIPYKNLSSGLYARQNKNEYETLAGVSISESNSTTSGAIDGFYIDQKSTGNLIVDPTLNFNFSAQAGGTSGGEVVQWTEGNYVGLEGQSFGFSKVGAYLSGDTYADQAALEQWKRKWCPTGDCSNSNWQDAEGSKFRVFEQKARELGFTLEWYNDAGALEGSQLIAADASNSYLDVGWSFGIYKPINNNGVEYGNGYPNTMAGSWSFKFKNNISLPKDANTNYYKKYKLYANIRPSQYEEFVRGSDDPRVIYFLVSNTFNNAETNPVTIDKWSYKGIYGKAKPNSTVNIYYSTSPSTPINTSPIQVDGTGAFSHLFTAGVEGLDKNYTNKDQFIITASDNSGYNTTSRVTLQIVYNLPENPVVAIDNSLPGSSNDAAKTYERQLNMHLTGTPNSQYSIYASSVNKTDASDGEKIGTFTTNSSGQLNLKLGRNPYPGTSGLDAFDYLGDPNTTGFFLSNEYLFNINGAKSEVIGYQIAQAISTAYKAANPVYVTIENPFRYILEVKEHDYSKLTYQWSPSGGTLNNPSYEGLYKTWPRSGRDIGPLVSEGPELDLSNFSAQGSQVIKENYVKGRKKGAEIYTNKVGDNYLMTGTAQPLSTISVKILGQNEIVTTASSAGTWSASIPLSSNYTNGQDVYFRIKESYSTQIANSILSTSGYTEIVQGLFVIDRVSPSAPVLLSSNQKYTSFPLIKGTAEQWSTVSIVVNGKTYTSYSDGNFAVQVTDDLSAGEYDAVLFTTDRAGNKSPEVSFKLYIVAPPVSNVISYNENSMTYANLFSNPIDLGNDQNVDFSRINVTLSSTIVNGDAKLFINSSGLTVTASTKWISFNGTSREKISNILSLNGAEVAMIVGNISLSSSNSKQLIENGENLEFSLLPIYNLNSSTITIAGIETIDARNLPPLSFNNGSIETILNGFQFYSNKQFEFNASLAYKNIHFVTIDGYTTNGVLPISGSTINLVNVDDVPSGLLVTAPNGFDTHRQDRTVTATFTQANFVDADKTDLYKAELYKISVNFRKNFH